MLGRFFWEINLSSYEDGGVLGGLANYPGMDSFPDGGGGDPVGKKALNPPLPEEARSETQGSSGAAM